MRGAEGGGGAGGLLGCWAGTHVPLRAGAPDDPLWVWVWVCARPGLLCARVPGGRARRCTGRYLLAGIARCTAAATSTPTYLLTYRCICPCCCARLARVPPQCARLPCPLDAAARVARAGDRTPLTNIVYMGMGEPLHNLGAVLASSEVISHYMGLHISHNKVG